MEKCLELQWTVHGLMKENTYAALEISIGRNNFNAELLQNFMTDCYKSFADWFIVVEHYDNQLISTVNGVLA